MHSIVCREKLHTMMSCTRRTSAMNLVVVTLLIVSLLLTLHLPTAACARQVAVLNPNNNGRGNRGNKNLGEALAATASTDDDDGLAASGKVFSGRKLSAPNKEGTKATTVGATTTTTSAGSRPRTVKMRAATRHGGDEATEMYDMLRRDYASKASRRRPINNGATPLLQVNKKP